MLEKTVICGQAVAGSDFARCGNKYNDLMKKLAPATWCEGANFADVSRGFPKRQLAPRAIAHQSFAKISCTSTALPVSLSITEL